MRVLAACLFLFAGSAHATWFGVNNRAFPNQVQPCPVTSGPLTLSANSPRVTGIAPLLVFFDATATTDSSVVGNTTVFQDVTFTWSYGDNGASGSSKWLYGSNAGNNSKNTSTGAIGSHLYVTAGNDTNYTVTVTAVDLAGNTATCTPPTVTAYDPSGVNGFPGTATTCVAQATTPVAGSGGCPAGASVLTTTSFNTALASMGNNKRVLLKCGDSFSGTLFTFTAVKFSIGAYGGCENTTTSRPILTDTSGGGHIAISVASSASGDGRVTDLDLEGSTGSGAALQVPAGNNIVPYQLTWYNIASNSNGRSYYTPQASQFGLIASTQTTENNIGTFINNGGNNPASWTGPFPNDDYQAILGNSINGAGVTNGSGIELVRIAACRLCVVANNDLQHANNVGAVLKFHGGNPGSASAWAGVYTEFVEISDNKFFGQSGGQLVEIAPQNASVDERMRNIVMERNLFAPVDSVGVALMVSAQNTTLRDNAFYIPAGQVSPAYFMAEVGIRPAFPVTAITNAASAVVTINLTTSANPFNVGASLVFFNVGGMTQINGLTGTITAIGGSSGAWTETVNINSSGFSTYTSGGVVSPNFLTQYVEAYNNTCALLSSKTGSACIALSGTVPMSLAPFNSIAKNNLYYSIASNTTVLDSGTSDTVSNNTVTNTNNPAFTNGGGSFSLISDFKPTANFTGGVSVPVIYDALGTAWSPTWDWGAVHH